MGHPPPYGRQNHHPELCTKAFPGGVDLIMTSPPMLPQHLPRAHRGQGQSAQATVGWIRYLIQHLAANQEGGIRFVWDTPVGSPLPAHVKKIMGPSTVLNAPKCCPNTSHGHTGDKGNQPKQRSAI